MPRALVLPLVLALAFGCVACGGAESNRTATGRLKVVAAENFWGDLAQQIGGSHVAVTSLINSPDADPHLYDPGTSNGLAVATAGVVIVNGANYDPFMERLLNAAPSGKREVVRVSDVLHIEGSDPNPHLWYDAPRLPAVVEAIKTALIKVDPANRSAYLAGASRTIVALQPLEHAVTLLHRTDAGTPVAYTERVPGYLLAAAGLTVLTPSGFARSIEDGTDPSPSDTVAMRDLITGHRIVALLYNQQATSPITSQLEALARDNGVAVVPVTETMPRGQTLVSWQLAQVRALAAGLSR